MWPPQSNKICGTWVKDQRRFGRKFMNDPESTSAITQERVDKLNEAGFDWNPVSGGTADDVSIDKQSNVKLAVVRSHSSSLSTYTDKME